MLKFAQKFSGGQKKKRTMIIKTYYNQQTEVICVRRKKKVHVKPIVIELTGVVIKSSDV